MKILKLKMIIGCCLIISISFALPLSLNFNMNPHRPESKFQDDENLNSSGEVSYVKEWMKNNNFSTQDYWFSQKGDQGDNETVESTITSGQADFKVLGESLNYTLFGIPNSTDSPSWYEFAKPEYYLPDNTIIDTEGCRVSHTWAEGSNQFPGVHWRKNITLPEDMSDYNITSATLNVIFNASVSTDVDVLGESAANQYGIGDFVTFYVLISDIDFKNPYIVALNKTRDLGRDSGPTAINDKLIETYSEEVLITALNSAFEKDQYHSNFTITLGIDIYSEDNWGSDVDTFPEIYIKDCNLTFTFERKIEKFTSISWNQIGNNISGADIRIEDANLKFKYKIDQQWPTNLSAFSEIRILINDNPHTETIRLSSANLTFGEAKIGGFDVTNLIQKDVNITLSIQVFIANTFGYDNNITISIDDVSLKITYIETIPDISSDLILILNGDDKTLDPIITIPYSEDLNVTIQYKENSSGFHIPNATVRLIGRISGLLFENLTLNQYSLNINTSMLGVGVNTFTIEAQKNLYETQNIQFVIEVVERETYLELLIDDNPKVNSDTVQVQVDDSINVTVYYKDNVTKKHLRGAAVTLEGIGALTEIKNGYYLNINARDFNQKISALIINAQLHNYTPRNIQFFIEIVERNTDLKLFLNNEEKTADPTTEQPIGSILNITLKFTDNNTGFHISNATTEMIGNFISLNLTEDPILKQYGAVLNTTSLSIGVNLFEITAYKSNYETQSLFLRITVNKINTIIRREIGDSHITVEPGQNVDLRIILNNTDFGGFIKGAVVTYRWAYGEDNFTDLDNDGIYEAVLQNVTLGTFVITITASGNENFNFESFEITLSVVKEVSREDLTWLVYVLMGVIVGAVSGFTAYQLHFKYPPMVRKIRKLRKKIRKGKKVKPIITLKRNEVIDNRVQDKSSVLELESVISESKIVDKIEKTMLDKNLKEGD
jgi:hypothetical protein